MRYIILYSIPENDSKSRKSQANQEKRTRRRSRIMENEKIIQEVLDLLKIPDVGWSLLHKIEELKFILSRNIDTYRNAAGMLKPSQESFQTVKGTKFELNRVGENLWIPSLAPPPPPPGKMDANAYDIIPQPLIDYIVHTRTEKGIVVMKPGVELPALKGRVFDLFFEKVNPVFIWGVAAERQLDRSGFIYPDPRTGKNTFQDLRENAEKDEIIKLLLYYLLTCENYYHHVVNEFFCRWKPLIDSQLLTGLTELTEPTAM